VKISFRANRISRLGPNPAKRSQLHFPLNQQQDQSVEIPKLGWVEIFNAGKAEYWNAGSKDGRM